jgi:hypothetical protein
MNQFRVIEYGQIRIGVADFLVLQKEDKTFRNIYLN